MRWTFNIHNFLGFQNSIKPVEYCLYVEEEEETDLEIQKLTKYRNCRISEQQLNKTNVSTNYVCVCIYSVSSECSGRNIQELNRLSIPVIH